MIKINRNIAFLSFLIATLISLSIPNIQSSYADPYDSGYDHGCDDAGIDDPSDYYINQDEKGPSYHTAKFMDGYNDGFAECSSSGNGDEEYYDSGDEYGSQQSPQQYSSSSQSGDTVIEDIGQLVECATTAAPLAAPAGPLGIMVGGLGCGLYAGSD